MFLTPINWDAPWMARYKTLGIWLSKRITSGAPVYQALNELLLKHPQITCPIRFVPQEESQGAPAYEWFIWQTKTVPTRNNLHDFFNGLMWLHFPAIKQQLNALQASAIQASGISTQRGVLRDALTIFDENAAFLIESTPKPELLPAIRHKNWLDVFLHKRSNWHNTQCILFGHALLEKLVTPRKAITAHIFCPQTTFSTFTEASITANLTPNYLSTKPFAPLPVLGIPNWWDENNHPNFYQDTLVFRPLEKPRFIAT